MGRERRVMVTGDFECSRLGSGFPAPTLVDRADFRVNALERAHSVTKEAMVAQVDGTNVSRELTAGAP